MILNNWKLKNQSLISQIHTTLLSTTTYTIATSAIILNLSQSNANVILKKASIDTRENVATRILGMQERIMEFKCQDNGILVVCYLKCDEELYIELFECGTITGDIKEEKDVGEFNCLINDGA